MQKKVSRWGALVFLMITLGSCSKEEAVYPRPTGYFRIDFPEKSYRELNDDCPFEFEIPSYCHVEDVKGNGNCFKNIHFGWYKATLHCTYAKTDDLIGYANMAKKFAYEHKIFASAIEEIPFKNDSARVFGLRYNIKGDVAMNYSFYLTDSVDRYFAGSLYFQASPNYDSIQPTLEFLQQDIEHLIQTFRWKSGHSLSPSVRQLEHSH